MSYRTQALLANDKNIMSRVTACASTQGFASPQSWAWDHAWQLSAQPGWDDAYGYAVNAAVPDPGNQENVITDAMILSAVQVIKALEADTTTV